jgi:hypothetical protein
MKLETLKLSSLRRRCRTSNKRRRVLLEIREKSSLSGDATSNDVRLF